jgi:TonB family protein
MYFEVDVNPDFKNKMKRYLKERIVLFVVVSLFVHASVLTLMQFVTPPPVKVAQEVIEIDYRTDSTKALKQIVEQDEKRLNEDEPDKEAYLGRHTQRVVKETRAANHGDFKNRSGEGKPKTNPVKQAEQAEKPQEKQAKQRSKVSATGALPTLGDLKPTFKPSYQRQFEDIPSGKGGETSATNDHLKDKHVGIETMLNSREFVYYTYYQRIRSQLRQYWEPSIRERVKKIFAQGRTIASTKDHITQVVIVLDKAGSLIKVQVVNESGVSDLDEAAVDAFRAAEPFPNPPKGMVEADGTIKIRWDFILEA